MSALLMLAALAAADDGAMVRCALGKTPRTEVAAMGGAVVASVETGATPTARTEALLGKLRARAADCTPGSGIADSRAGEIAVASVAVESLSAALQARGVDVIGINGQLRQTPPAVLDALIAKRRGAEVANLVASLERFAGPKASGPGVSRLIAGYAFNAARLAKLFASSAS